MHSGTAESSWSRARRAKVETVSRQRRVIFNDATCELSREDANTPEGFLRHRLNGVTITGGDVLSSAYEKSACQMAYPVSTPPLKCSACAWWTGRTAPGGASQRGPQHGPVRSQHLPRLSLCGRRVHLCRHGIPELKKAGGGSIINIGSISALTGSSIPQDASKASKGALSILTKSIAGQFAGDHIRCNIIPPGMINTPMQHKYMEDEDWLKGVLDSIPMGRFGEAEEIAYAALFLASDEFSYMTGAELVIDGGFYAT